MDASRDPGECVRRARDPATGPEELARLSTSEYIFVRQEVAAHPNTPAASLSAMVPAALGTPDDFRIAWALLTNPGLPASDCGRISRLVPAVLSSILPREYYARSFMEALGANAHASCEVLGVLLTPETPRHIREWIARKSRRADVLERLARDPSKIVRNVAVRAPGRLET